MISKSPLRIGCVLTALLFIAVAAHAEVRLPGLFSDQMVLQQGVNVPVWGWADEGEEVTVEFKGQKLKARAKDGRWRVTLPRLKASAEPAVLRVSGRNTIEIRDVLVGEVWVASGQSNMQWRTSPTRRIR
jgi:sialate O-acetylesterase